MATFTVGSPVVVEASYSLSDKAERQRSYTLEYEVIGSDRNFGADDAANAVGIALGDTYLGDSAAVCREASCHFDREKICTVSFTFRTGIVQAGNPLDQPAIYDWDFIDKEVPIAYDTSGDAIVNTAGVPYFPLLTVNLRCPTLTITKNVASVDPTQIYNYNNATNSDSFYGASVGSLRAIIKATQSYDSDIGLYYQMRYQFVQEIDARGNANVSPRNVMSMGFQELVSSKLRPILDNEGNPASEPSLLQLDGSVATDPADCYIQQIPVLPQLAFGSLGV